VANLPLQITLFSTAKQGCVEVFYMAGGECNAWKDGLMILDARGTISRTDGAPIDEEQYWDMSYTQVVGQAPCV